MATVLLDIGPVECTLQEDGDIVCQDAATRSMVLAAQYVFDRYHRQKEDRSYAIGLATYLVAFAGAYVADVDDSDDVPPAPLPKDAIS